MTCDFMSFSTVFQSSQDDERLKGCVQWNPIYSQEDLLGVGLKVGTARSVGQPLTHRAVEALRIQKLDSKKCRSI